MAPQPAVDGFVALFAFWWLAVIVVALTLGVFWPLMAFSAMRNVKKIRLELERLNEILESRLSADPLGGIKR